jgi:hypothetical protein
MVKTKNSNIIIILTIIIIIIIIVFLLKKFLNNNIKESFKNASQQEEQDETKWITSPILSIDSSTAKTTTIALGSIYKTYLLYSSTTTFSPQTFILTDLGILYSGFRVQVISNSNSLSRTFMVPSGSNVRIISNGESGYNNPTQNITLTGTTGKLVQLLFVYLNGTPIWIIYNLISF